MKTTNLNLPKQQKLKDKVWVDENGYQIPVTYINAFDRMREAKAHKLANDAAKLHDKLQAFKQEAIQTAMDIYKRFLKEKGIDATDRKGNFTFYDFDRKIRVEMDVKERITFDDMGIAAAKELLMKFLQDNVDAKAKFIKDLVMDAFQTSRGKLDVKKVLNLLKYESKIDDERFQEALKLIRESIIREDSKRYISISYRDGSGKWRPIVLNFASL